MEQHRESASQSTLQESTRADEPLEMPCAARAIMIVNALEKMTFWPELR
jgi:hypothetical protein